MEKNRCRRAALLAAIILVTAAVIMLGICFMTERAWNGQKAETITGPDPSAPGKNAGARPGAASSLKQTPSASAPGMDVFKTNEDIRRKYGRIETVHLVDGRIFTGAVISSTAAEYSIVTVGGVKKVPMRNVKMRVIIR